MLGVGIKKLFGIKRISETFKFVLKNLSHLTILRNFELKQISAIQLNFLVKTLEVGCNIHTIAPVFLFSINYEH